MGYNLYITRKNDWCDEGGPSITRDEWIAHVETDAELSFRHDDDSLTANWDGECSYPDPWFAYSDDTGAIDTKNPDAPIIQKMLEMAAKLGARVQGDDGEIYVTPTDYYHQDENGDPEVLQPALPWWRRLFRSS